MSICIHTYIHAYIHTVLYVFALSHIRNMQVILHTRTIHTHVYICIHTYIQCIHTYTQCSTHFLYPVFGILHTHTNTYTCIYVHTYIHTCIHIYSALRIHSIPYSEFASNLAYMHTHTYAYIHTYSALCIRSIPYSEFASKPTLGVSVMHTHTHICIHAYMYTVRYAFGLFHIRNLRTSQL